MRWRNTLVLGLLVALALATVAYTLERFCEVCTAEYAASEDDEDVKTFVENTVSDESSEPSESVKMVQNTDEIINKVGEGDAVGSSPTSSPVPSNPPSPWPSPPDDCECIQCYIGTDSPSASPSISLQPTGKGKGRSKKLSFGKRKSKGASCVELEISCNHEELCRDYCFSAPSAAPSISSEPSVSMFPSTSPSMSWEPSGMGVGKGGGKGGKGKGGSDKVRWISIIFLFSPAIYSVFLLT